MATTSTAGHAPTSATTAAATPAASAAVDENSEFHVDQSPDAGIFADVDTTGLTVVDLVTKLYDMPGVPSDRPDIANLRKPSPESIVGIVNIARRRLDELQRSPDEKTRQLIANHFSSSEAARRPALCVLLYTMEAPPKCCSIYTLLNAWLNSSQRQHATIAQYIGPFFVEYCRATTIMPRKTVSASRAMRVRDSDKLLHAFKHYDEVFRPLSVVNFWGVASFTKRDDVASRSEFGGGLNDRALLFKCDELECVDISTLSFKPNELEVQPLTPSRFRVVSSMRYHHKVFIVLQQIKSAVRYTSLPAVPEHLVPLVSAIRSDKKNAAGYLELARSMSTTDKFPLFGRKDAFVTRLSVCKQLLLRDPKSAEARGLLADSLPASDRARLQLYVFAINNDSPQSARNCLSLAKLLHPGETRRVLHRNMSRCELALLAYQKDPAMFDALMVVAEAFESDGGCAPIVLQQQQQHAVPHASIQRHEPLRSAIDVFKTILAHDPSHVDALWKLAHMASGGKRLELLWQIASVRETAAVYISIGENIPRGTPVRHPDGRSRWTKRDAFVHALQLEPDNFAAYLALARIEGDASLTHLHRRCMTVRDLYAAAIKLKPDFAPAYFELAGVLRAQEQVTLHFGCLTVRDLYVEVLRYDPRHTAACYGVAQSMSNAEEVSLHGSDTGMTKVALLARVIECDCDRRWPEAYRDLSLAMNPGGYAIVRDHELSRNQVFIEAALRIPGLGGVPLELAGIKRKSQRMVALWLAAAATSAVGVVWGSFYHPPAFVDLYPSSTSLLPAVVPLLLASGDRLKTRLAKQEPDLRFLRRVPHVSLTTCVWAFVFVAAALEVFAVPQMWLDWMTLLRAFQHVLVPSLTSAVAFAFSITLANRLNSRMYLPVSFVAYPRAIVLMTAAVFVLKGAHDHYAFYRSLGPNVAAPPAQLFRDLQAVFPATVCTFGLNHNCSGWMAPCLNTSSDFCPHVLNSCWSTPVLHTPCAGPFLEAMRRWLVFLAIPQGLLLLAMVFDAWSFALFCSVARNPVGAIHKFDPELTAFPRVDVHAPAIAGHLVHTAVNFS